MALFPSRTSSLRYSVFAGSRDVFLEHPMKKMGEDHPEGLRIGLPGDHIDAVTVHRLGNPLPYAEIAEDQAVELTLIFQRIDDHPLRRERLEPFHRLIGDPNFGEHLPEEPGEREIILTVETSRMIDADLRGP